MGKTYKVTLSIGSMKGFKDLDKAMKSATKEGLAITSKFLTRAMVFNPTKKGGNLETSKKDFGIISKSVYDKIKLESSNTVDEKESNVKFRPSTLGVEELNLELKFDNNAVEREANRLKQNPSRYIRDAIKRMSKSASGEFERIFRKALTSIEGQAEKL